MKDISTILFPANDVFTAFGPDNESYWVNCITRLEYLQGEEHYYYVTVIIELVLLFIGVAALNGFVLLAWKHRVVHINLLIIFTNYIVLIQIGLYCRMVLILYESKLVDIPGEFSHLICATRFVIDYERNVRFHISILLNISADVFSILIAAQIAKGVLNGYYLSLVALFPNPFYCLLFHLMIRRNKQRLAQISILGGGKSRDDYTLSLRVQLKENIWSMQKIESVLYLLTFLLACDLLFVFIPPLFLDRPEVMRELQWFTVAANIVVALTVVSVCLVAAISVAVTSDLIPAGLQRFMGRKLVESPCVKAENEAYFDRLSTQWNSAHQKQQFRF